MDLYDGRTDSARLSTAFRNDTLRKNSDLHHLGFGLTLAMAISCGMAVANIYYNQPILGLIERTFPEDRSLVDFVPTATQFGYAIGLLLLVPLGDLVERRRLILAQTALLAVSLAATAVAPSAATLLLASILVGVTASVAQQILPFAAELAPPERRGATIGTIMSGLLCGILLSRVVAGVVGVQFGWRAMFWTGLLLALVMAGLLFTALPRSPPAVRIGYGALLGSLATLWRRQRALRQATMIQAFVFGSFSALWTTLALHLDAHYHLSAEVAGLFGLVGAAGVLFAPLAGRIADRRGPRFVIGMATLIMVISWGLLGVWNSILGMVVGILLLDFGAQSAQVSNQHVIHGLGPDIRNRLNAVLMGGMFIGGAFGSAGASLLWNGAGWVAVCGFSAVLSVLAYGIHMIDSSDGSSGHIVD